MPERPAPTRPVVVTEPTAVSVAEQFQNQTIRPILKLVDSALETYWNHHWPKRKTPFDRLDKPAKLAYIDRAISEDTKLRMTIIGMVLGHFTADEWVIYKEQESELNRRIAALVVQRLQSRVGVTGQERVG